MKFKLKANADIDILTQKELREVMDEQHRKMMAAMASLDKEDLSAIRRVRANEVILGDGTITADLGSPPVSYIWDVRSVVISGANPLAAQPGQAGIFRGLGHRAGDAEWLSPASDLATGLPASMTWSKHQFVIFPGEKLAVSIAGGTPAALLVVSATVIEVPLRSQGNPL